MGLCEKHPDPDASRTLYNAQLFIWPNGGLLGKRQLTPRPVSGGCILGATGMHSGRSQPSMGSSPTSSAVRPHPLALRDPSKPSGSGHGHQPYTRGHEASPAHADHFRRHAIFPSERPVFHGGGNPEPHNSVTAGKDAD